MTAQQQFLDVHDYVTELTSRHTNRQTRIWEDDAGNTLHGFHTTQVPALIMQLLEAQPASQGSEQGSTSFASRPAARIEALDTVMLIDDEASRWIRRLGEDDPGDTLDKLTGHHIAGSGTIACIRMLHGLHASATACDREHGRRDCCTRHHIEHDIRRWWHQARIVSGWDSPAWRPDNTCPVCDVRRSLRINLNDQTALCIDCRTVWEAHEIGLLAEWIRSENADEEAPEGDDAA